LQRDRDNVTAGAKKQCPPEILKFNKFNGARFNIAAGIHRTREKPFIPANPQNGIKIDVAIQFG
jgi:hypothetical protein